MEFDLIMPKSLSEEQIEQIIPHRRPFRFIDKILEVEFGKRAVGMLSDLTRPEYAYLKSHFPTYQVVPGAIILEALAEVGAIAILGLPEHRDKIALLTGQDRWRYRSPTSPGIPVRLEAEIIRLRSRFGRGYVRALIDDQAIAAEGIIDFAIIRKPKFMTN